jgi:uncharacterized membrane protein
VAIETDRLEAFSDGVFAIAATLLVLEIRVPEAGALGKGLIELWPSYLAYAVSFIVIGAIWLNHHRMFDQIVRVDHALLLLNALHLMIIAFIPFPTAVLARALHDRVDQALATAFYGATLTVIGALVTTMWWYAAREHRFLDPATPRGDATKETRRLLVGPVAYGIATLIALVAPGVALACFIALNVFFLWPRRRHLAGPQSSG